MSEALLNKLEEDVKALRPGGRVAVGPVGPLQVCVTWKTDDEHVSSLIFSTEYIPVLVTQLLEAATEAEKLRPSGLYTVGRAI